MLGLLRFIAVVNASIWLGGAFFFTVVAGPAFFSAEMAKILPRAFAGAAAMVVIERFFWLQHCCAVVAVAHLLAEWVYAGRPIQRLTLILLLALLALGLMGGFWLQPRLRQLHAVVYSNRYPAELVRAAQSAFRWRHGMAQGLNLIIMGGLVVYLRGLTFPPTPVRLTTLTQLRR